MRNGSEGLAQEVSNEQEPLNAAGVRYTNHAVILIKPHAANKETIRFVQSCLAKSEVALLGRGAVSCADLGKKRLFKRQYFNLDRNASLEPQELVVPAAGIEIFENTYGKSWTDALNNDQLMSASKAMSALHLNSEELYAAIRNGVERKLAPSLQVASVKSENDTVEVYVINGFMPRFEESFCFTETAGDLRYDGLVWMNVKFDPGKLSWKRFRCEVVGSTDVTTAHPESIRGQFYQHWKEMGLLKQPDKMNNCLHVSKGPLDAFRDRKIWTGLRLFKGGLGRALLERGVPESAVLSWAENPVVELFDSSVDSDTGAFINSAVRFAEKHYGLEEWVEKEETIMRKPSLDGLTRFMTILHFNDVYNVDPGKTEPVGGVARFVTKVRQLRAESLVRGEPEAVTLFSGDVFNPSLTSTVTKGKHMVSALNAIGIQIACFGNHDFDFGVDKLIKLAADTNFPWLMSNVVDKGTGRPLADGEVTRTMDFGGRKIGVIGLVEREWLVTLATIEVDDVCFEDFCQCGRRLARQLKDKEGAQMVIALTHMRSPNDELLAHTVPEIDLILGGHDHHYDVKPVGPHGTYVLKSGTDFRDLTELRLEFSKDAGGRPFKVKGWRHITIDSTIIEDPEMKAFVDDCMNKLSAAMDDIIGETAVDLDCRFISIRTQETNIGNLIADVMRAGLKTDIAALNSGTLRSDSIIEKGPFKVRDLVKLLPMLDELCILQLSGEQVMLVLENAVSQYPRLEGRFLQVSGVEFTFDADKASGQRIIKETVMVGGQPIDDEKKYKVAARDYLRQGKDGFDVFRGAVCLADGEQTGILPTLVRDHFKSISALNGFTSSTTDAARKRSMCIGCEMVGEGPTSMRHFAINPKVEGRIKCLNPKI